MERMRRPAGGEQPPGKKNRVGGENLVSAMKPQPASTDVEVELRFLKEANKNVNLAFRQNRTLLKGLEEQVGKLELQSSRYQKVVEGLLSHWLVMESKLSMVEPNPKTQSTSIPMTNSMTSLLEFVKSPFVDEASDGAKASQIIKNRVSTTESRLDALLEKVSSSSSSSSSSSPESSVISAHLSTSMKKAAAAEAEMSIANATILDLREKIAKLTENLEHSRMETMREQNRNEQLANEVKIEQEKTEAEVESLKMELVSKNGGPTPLTSPRPGSMSPTGSLSDVLTTEVPEHSQSQLVENLAKQVEIYVGELETTNLLVKERTEQCLGIDGVATELKSRIHVLLVDLGYPNAAKLTAEEINTMPMNIEELVKNHRVLKDVLAENSRLKLLLENKTKDLIDHESRVNEEIAAVDQRWKDRMAQNSDLLTEMKSEMKEKEKTLLTYKMEISSLKAYAEQKPKELNELVTKLNSLSYDHIKRLNSDLSSMKKTLGIIRLIDGKSLMDAAAAGGGGTESDDGDDGSRVCPPWLIAMMSELKSLRAENAKLRVINRNAKSSNAEESIEDLKRKLSLVAEPQFSLAERVKDLETQIDLMRGRAEAAEASAEESSTLADALSIELDAVAQAFEESQTANSQLVDEAKAKQEDQAKRMKERVKQQQVESLLREEKNILVEKVNAEEKAKLALKAEIEKMKETLAIMDSTLSKYRMEVAAATRMRRGLETSENVAKMALETAKEQKTLILNEKRQLRELKNKQKEELDATKARMEELQNFEVVAKRKIDHYRHKLGELDTLPAEKALTDQIAHMTNEVEELKLVNQSQRKRIICPTCNVNERNALITKCYHTFCFDCLKQRVKDRSRKCPGCGQQFGDGDIHQYFVN